MLFGVRAGLSAGCSGYRSADRGGKCQKSPGNLTQGPDSALLQGKKVPCFMPALFLKES